MGLAELLILVIFLVIVAVILRLMVAALRSRKNRIKIALEKNIPVYDLEELELRELPNGGARMVQRSFEEVMRQAAALDSLDAAKKRPRSKVLKTDLSREAVLARRAAALAAAEAAAARGEVPAASTRFDESAHEAESDSTIEPGEPAHRPESYEVPSVDHSVYAQASFAGDPAAYDSGTETLAAVEVPVPELHNFEAPVSENSVNPESDNNTGIADETEVAESDTEQQADMIPPSWAVAAVRADEYQSTRVQSDNSQNDYADDDYWMDDVSPVREVPVSRPAAQQSAAQPQSSAEYMRAEPRFSMMRFDDELGLVADDESEAETEAETEEVEDEETADYFLDSAVDDNEVESSVTNVVTEVDTFADEALSSAEDDDEPGPSEFENSAYDYSDADDGTDVYVSIDSVNTEKESEAEARFDTGAVLDDEPHISFDLHDAEPAYQEPAHQETEMLQSARYEPEQQKELADVLDELLHERGVSTDVDYSRVPETALQPQLELTPQLESEPEYSPPQRPEPEELPAEAPAPDTYQEPEQEPEYQPLPDPEPEAMPAEELPESEPDAIPETTPAEMPEFKPEELPELEPEEWPEPEPEELPEPAPEEVPEPEPEEEPLPDFDSELEADPDPQPQPVDSFAAVDNKDDIDDLFKDEDQQRRLEALEQEQDSSPKRFMSWAGAAIGKFTASIAESRARAAEEKAIREELAREQAAVRAEQQAQQRALQLEQQKEQQQRQAEQTRQAAEQARLEREVRAAQSDFQDPLADYSIDDEQYQTDDYQPVQSDHDDYQEKFAAHERDESGFDERGSDDARYSEAGYHEQDSEEQHYELFDDSEPVANASQERNIDRYGESPYKQHQFGHAPAVEAAATAASATAAASAAKTKHKKPQRRNLRENQLSLEMPTEEETIDSGFSQVLVINVMARPNSSIHGDELLPAMLSAGLRFGDMSIFHRHADRRGGPVLFSVANALNPGTFDLNEISDFTTQGVTFFMTLPNVANNMLAFEQMLATARHVQSALDAELKDDNRSVMTAQTVEHYRQRIRDFELQQLKNSRQK
jgi:cell division protein ZipA